MDVVGVEHGRAVEGTERARPMGSAMREWDKDRTDALQEIQEWPPLLRWVFASGVMPAITGLCLLIDWLDASALAKWTLRIVGVALVLGLLGTMYVEMALHLNIDPRFMGWAGSWYGGWHHH